MSLLVTQLINLFAAVILMLAFAMITQRRILSLIHLFTLQGAALVAATAVVGYVTHQPHLYLSAAPRWRCWSRSARRCASSGCPSSWPPRSCWQ